MSTPQPNPIDIRASADQVISRLQQGQRIEAMRVLESLRMQQPTVVQEALDRYVAAGAQEQLQGLEQVQRLGIRLGEVGMGSLLATRQTLPTTPTPAQTLDRLLETRNMPPRMPNYSHDASNELAGLTPAQQYDVYASIAELRGNAAAKQALQRNGESVLLGLRQENSTLASADGQQRGTGLYNDQMVVLQRSANGERSLYITSRANTEPTAQYAARAKPSPQRKNTPYANVQWRRTEGRDVNADGISDQGRMAEGTFEMEISNHPNPGNIPDEKFAFRPSLEQLTPTRKAGLIQRDTNGDGWFNQNDINGTQDLDRTFKIHSGSGSNTDSAGCQTIHPEDYRAFMNAAKAYYRPDGSGQNRWQYVLTHVGDGPAQDQQQRQQRTSPRPPLRTDAEQTGTQTNNIPTQHISQQQTQSPGPFNDPLLDRYYASVMAGDSQQADQAAVLFAQSLQGLEMAQQGQQLLAEQQIQQEQQLAQTQPAPVMKI